MVRFSDVLIALAVLAVVLGGCTDDDRRPHEPAPIASSGAPPFHPPSYPSGRRIDTIAAASAGVGRSPFFIVASRADSLRGPGRFDLIEVHAYDSSSRRWMRAFADSIEAAQSVVVRDVTGDGRDDVIVQLAYGGNDPVATNGMHVYSSHGGSMRRVFRSTWMDPRIDSLDGIDETVITVHRALWPQFAPRADALIYVEDIHGYRDGRFRSILDETRLYYAKAARRARDEYEDARKAYEQRPVQASDSTGMTPHESPENDSLAYAHELSLYQRSALVVLKLVKSGDTRGARLFWNSEKAFLRSALRQEQFDELEAFCTRLIDAG